MSARTRRRQSKGLKRRSGTRPTKKIFRIYSEGIQTELDYINALKRIPEISESLTIDQAFAISIEKKGAPPRTLVEAAVEHKRDSNLEVDEYWCVIDVESPQNHPYLPEAHEAARNNEIYLAISNPCFEIWLILHFQDQFAYLTTDQAIRRRKLLDGSLGKGVEATVYIPLLAEATRRAKMLQAVHKKDQKKFPKDNPSSTFYTLIEGIQRATKNPSA